VCKSSTRALDAVSLSFIFCFYFCAAAVGISCFPFVKIHIVDWVSHARCSACGWVNMPVVSPLPTLFLSFGACGWERVCCFFFLLVLYNTSCSTEWEKRNTIDSVPNTIEIL
jgi:hypothetical protein